MWFKEIIGRTLVSCCKRWHCGNKYYSSHFHALLVCKIVSRKKLSLLQYLQLFNQGSFPLSDTVLRTNHDQIEHFVIDTIKVTTTWTKSTPPQTIIMLLIIMMITMQQGLKETLFFTVNLLNFHDGNLVSGIKDLKRLKLILKNKTYWMNLSWQL